MVETENNRGKKHIQVKDFLRGKILSTFANFLRIAHLIWAASPSLTLSMTFCMLLRGFIPIITIIASRQVIDRTVIAMAQGKIEPVVFPIIVLVFVQIIDNFSSRLTQFLQPLIQARLTNHIQIMILRQSDLLDLSFFENADFYDKLRRASQEAANKPVWLISEFFDFGRSLIVLLSVLSLLFQLSWWLPIVTIIIPIPLLIANSRYGLKSYWIMISQSPERRQLTYINSLMTTDTYIKEVKLFNVGEFSSIVLNL